MGTVSQLIAKYTDGESFSTNKLCLDHHTSGAIDYDEEKYSCKTPGEKNPPSNYVSLRKEAQRIQNLPPLFCFFLDGSRRTYKVDDIVYNRRVYPEIAGQICVGCTQRENRQLHQYKLKKELVVVLPAIANKDSAKMAVPFFGNLLKKINQNRLLAAHNIRFDEILRYSDTTAGKKQSHQDLAVEQIQNRMMDIEKQFVMQLVKDNAIDENHFLLKDGSLEYRSSRNASEYDLVKIKNNFRWVVGVSKSFNPEFDKDSQSKSNAQKIASLPLFHRTPAYMYRANRTGGVRYAIWYLRIRDPQYSNSPFAGIVKVEKILITPDEEAQGLDSEMVDLISANIINERNPVCFGQDERWANHLYPIFLTETFAKSQYLSTNYFLNIF